MLLRQDRGRNQDGNLVSIFNRLERSSHRDFRFSEPDVAAQQPLHRLRVLHVLFDGGDGGQLVGRLVIRKRLFEFVLPLSFHSHRDARSTLAFGLQVNHLRCHVRDRGLNGSFSFLPAGSADLRQPRRRLRSADVFLDQVDLGGRHIDSGSGGEFKFHVLRMLTVLLQHLQSTIAPDAVR